MARWIDRPHAWDIALVIGSCLVFLPLRLSSAAATPPSTQNIPDLPERPSAASPFEEGRPQSLFYPDEIDRQVGRAIIDAYLGDRESIRAHLDALRREDEARRREGRPMTGLSAGLRDLLNSTLTDRAAFLAAQKAALDKAAEPEEEALISWRLERDELTRANDLYHQSVVNRLGKVLNRLLRAINLTSFLVDPLMAPVIDSALDVVLHPGDLKGMSVEERKALVLYQRFLARYPEDPEAEDVRKDVVRLLAKKRQALLAQEIDRGEEAFQAGDLWTAERHFQGALGLDPASDAAGQGMTAVESRGQEERGRRARALETSPQPPPFKGAPDETLYYDLLLATTRRQPTRMREMANTLASRHQADRLWGAAMDILALSYELEGQKEKAHQILWEVADRGQSPSRQARARLLLEDSGYNQLVAIRAAERRHLKDTLSYILGGRGALEQAIVHSPTSLLLYGTPAAIPLGTATAAGIGIRGIQVLTGNPVPRSAIIEAGEEYLREHPPPDPHYGEVCRLLAQAYEQEERYNRAIYYYREAGTDPDKIRNLEEHAAETLLDRAGQSPTPQKTQFLATILRDYPETAAAREAGRKFRALTAPQYQGLRLSKRFLEEHPVVAQEGLRLKASLLDGDLDNGEIAAEGVALLEADRLVITFESAEGTRSEVYGLDRATMERVLRILRQGVYQTALQEAEDAGDDPAGRPDLPAFLFSRNPAEERVDRNPEVRLKRYEFLGKEERQAHPPFPLPEIEGSATANDLRLEGFLPIEPLGTRLSIGLDQNSPFTGAEVPVPDPIPLNLRLEAHPDTRSLPSISPQIRLFKEEIKDAPLYK
ncbi:MAG: tol-pal system YbgF family protein [Candidatus Methylomirabilales bacterium]